MINHKTKISDALLFHPMIILLVGPESLKSSFKRRSRHDQITISNNHVTAHTYNELCYVRLSTGHFWPNSTMVFLCFHT